jgi:hypothetical protein
VVSLVEAITLSIGRSFHDSYELVTRDELVVVAESDNPGPRSRFDVRALDFVRVSASTMVTVFWLIVVFALVWPRPACAYLNTEVAIFAAGAVAHRLFRSAQASVVRFCSFVRKLPGANWRDGLICDRPLVQRAGLRVAHLAQPHDPRKEARR